MKASKYVDILGVVWNSVTIQLGSPGSGVLGPGQGVCKCVKMHPPAPHPSPSVPAPCPCGPRQGPLTFGKHVGQGCEVLGVDKRDVELGLHGWFIEAWEGLPGVCGLHLRCGHHPTPTRKLEAMLGLALRMLPGMQGKGYMEVYPSLTPSPAPAPASPRSLRSPARPADWWRRGLLLDSGCQQALRDLG